MSDGPNEATPPPSADEEYVAPQVDTAAAGGMPCSCSCSQTAGAGAGAS